MMLSSSTILFYDLFDLFLPTIFVGSNVWRRFGLVWNTIFVHFFLNGKIKTNLTRESFFFASWHHRHDTFTIRFQTKLFFSAVLCVFN